MRRVNWRRINASWRENTMFAFSDSIGLGLLVCLAGRTSQKLKLDSLVTIQHYRLRMKKCNHNSFLRLLPCRLGGGDSEWTTGDLSAENDLKEVKKKTSMTGWEDGSWRMRISTWLLLSLLDGAILPIAPFHLPSVSPSGRRARGYSDFIFFTPQYHGIDCCFVRKYCDQAWI